jgi:hypothetical protein
MRSISPTLLFDVGSEVVANATRLEAASWLEILELDKDSASAI